MRFISLLFFLIAPNAFAQSGDIQQTSQALVQGWSGWMEKHRITQGAMAISHRGEIIIEQGINRTASDPAPVASLSKAITAICALHALKAAGKTHKLKLQDALPSFFSKYRVKDRRLFSVTVGQLISHDSGIHSNFTKRYKTLKTFEDPQKELQMRMIALERLGSNPGRSNYHYSNANYLTLGLVIEELTGQAYETYCAREILAPLGISNARVSQKWAVASSFGGWEISAKDYLTFLNAHFADNFILGQSPTRFSPKVHIGNNRYYGPGVLFRKTDKGTLVWHAGAWKWQDDTISDSFGAYFLMLDNGLALTVNFNDAASNGKLEELERVLWDASH